MKKILRILAIVVIFGLVISAIVISTNRQPSNEEKIWDKAMTVGDINAKNYFIIYSDLACPYCIAFENAIVENEEEFKDYIKKNDILVEIRLSDFLYEYGESQAASSRHSALAAYCARDEGKFWDYYNKAVGDVWSNYFKSSGKSGFIKLNAAGDTYWINIGKEIGLGDEFENCVKDQKPLEEIKANAKKTSRLASGMPYFKLNNYSPPGFSLSGTWEDVKAYFKAGLES